MAVDQRLPQVGQDDGVWGDLLRQYLMKEHYNDDTDNPINGGHKTITVQPGTAAAGSAPLKFSSGTLLSSAEAGAVEFNGNYFYASSGSPTATRRKIAMYDHTGEAKGDIYYQDANGYFTRLPIGTQGQILTVNGSGLPVWQSDSGTITGKTIDDTNIITVKDANFTLKDNDDLTKQAKFELNGLTTGTLRTYTLPDVSTTLVGSNATQTLTGKTISGLSNTITDIDTAVAAAISADFDNPTASDMAIYNTFLAIWASAAIVEDDETLSNEDVTFTASQRAIKDYVDTTVANASGGDQVYDISYISTFNQRAIGLGDNPFGVRLSRDVTFTEVVYRGITADSSGDLEVTLCYNGNPVIGTELVIDAADQTDGGANATATGEWSFAEGDVLTVEITGVGSDPGVGLAADIKGRVD